MPSIRNVRLSRNVWSEKAPSSMPSMRTAKPFKRIRKSVVQGSEGDRDIIFAHEDTQMPLKQADKAPAQLLTLSLLALLLATSHAV